MKQTIQKQSHPGPQYASMNPSVAGNQHQLSKSQYILPPGGQSQPQQQNATYAHTTNANHMAAIGGNSTAGQQNGRSASSGTNYNHKTSKSQIQPVFAMKNRKVKNASYSQQRTDRIDKVQQNFGSQSGLQAPQNYQSSAQLNQNMGISRDLAGGLTQYEGATSSLTMAANQQMHQAAVQVPVQPQMQQQIKHQYNSTQPAPGSHPASGFGINQGYQSMQNAKLKNQKNYQAKVQKARRLGSSQGIGNQQNQGSMKTGQAGQNSQAILNLQQITNSQSQLNNMPSMFHQSYKNNGSSTNASNQPPAMISSSNPPSSGGNSRSKSVHQQANSSSNIYGLIANHQQPQNSATAAGSTAQASQGQPSNGLMDPPSHTSTKSHHFTSSNPIAIDPYNNQQSPQIGGFGYQQQSMNVTGGMKHHPKTAKQQRSLSDHFGGTRRQQQQHGVPLKQMDQQQQPTSVVAQSKKGSKQSQGMPSSNKTNLLNVNQGHQQMAQMQFQQRINASQAQLDSFNNHGSLLVGANAQNIVGNHKQMTQQKFQNSVKSQKDQVGSQKMIQLNSKLSGIYKQYKTTSGGQGNQGSLGQINDNVLSPKDFGYMTQTQNNQKQSNLSHSQAQKQMSQSGQIQYNIGQHSLMHDGGRNVQNRLMSFQPPSQGANQTLKNIDSLQKNQINRDRSPNGTTSALNGPSQSLTIKRNNDYQAHNSAKLAGHNLKSQSMQQIPVTQQQQPYSHNKYSMFDSQINQNNYTNATGDVSHPDNAIKRQQVAKLGQVHSMANLGSNDQPHISGRLPSEKRSEGHAKQESSREQQKTNQTHHIVPQRQVTPSNKHRRMSPKIQGIDNNTQIENSRPNIAGNSMIQGIRVGNQELTAQMSASNQGYNTQPAGSYNSQQLSQQDSKAQVSAAPASGVNSNISQIGSSHLIDRQAHVNQYMDPKSLVGIVNTKTDLVNALPSSIKQIPIRQVKVRNQTGSFVEPSRSFNLSLKDSQGIGKIEKGQVGDNQAILHQRVQSHQNAPDTRTEQKSLTETQFKQGFHQRKEARVPSAGKKRTASGQGLGNKRIPSAHRLNKQITEQQKPQIQQKQQNLDEKKKDNFESGKDEQTGNIFKPRSSQTNIRRSRNEGKTNLPDATNNDMLDVAGNPTSAGQSTSSLYKQEQINKKFKFQENSNRESSQPNVTPKENNKSQEQAKPQGIPDNEEQGTYDQTKNAIPSQTMKKNKSKSGLETDASKPGENNAKDKNQEKSQGAEAGSTAATQDRKALFSVAPSSGLSGRNLYFNQIRSEINLSESGKCKSLPDYQNAKYSNKRNGLVAGYGANTNQGIVRNYNEDRVAIILNIMKPKSKNYESQAWPKCSFFGIYDGHGGAVCADFLRDYLHQFIIKDENFPQNPIQALRNGFREAERLFMEFAESQEKEAGEIDRSGSCAVVILIIDDMCYCANTGDSRSIMSADGGEKLFLLSTDHKPTDEIEMKRIIEQGGRIYQNSQVIQTNPSLGEVGKQMVYGPHRVFPGRLSVSRTIGDIEAKIEKYEGNPNVVIADPDVTAFEIKDNHDFIVIGCDGVFDKLSSKDAIHIAWQKVLMETAKQNVSNIDPQQTHQNCGHCVDGILRTSALRRTVDNVTCVVVAFDGFQKQLQKFIANNQDGTTVDVIEEIQLEPIPEYLSNTKLNQQNKKVGGSSDNSMLLLDDNQALQESANPLIGGRNLKGAKATDGAAKKNNAANPEKLLSEIAEEDDVSSVSESAQNKIGAAYGKVSDEKLGRVGKGSIHSITDKSLNENDEDQASLTDRDIHREKASIEQKRRSQIVPQYSATVGKKSGTDDTKKQYVDASQLDEVELTIGLPKKPNKQY